MTDTEQFRFLENMYTQAPINEPFKPVIKIHEEDAEIELFPMAALLTTTKPALSEETLSSTGKIASQSRFRIETCGL